MTTARSFVDLEVWKAIVELVVDIYGVTRAYPADERFVTVAQMRRAAISIGANLAEENSRCTMPAYLNHVQVALGSHGELRALVLISQRLGFVDSSVHDRLAGRLDLVGRLLSGLRRALQTRMRSDP